MGMYVRSFEDGEGHLWEVCTMLEGEVKMPEGGEV
jgi:predicted lactoylglutathione lyase